MQSDINYLSAKLEEIHADVKLLQDHVDKLRLESAGKKAVQRFLLTSVGMLSGVVVWAVHHLLKIV